MPQKPLIIMPTYNERENLRSIVTEVLEILPNAHVLIIDDNSPDGTGEIADAMSAENQAIKVIHREGKLGLGTAYVLGFRHALKYDYDAIFEMDADFSHDPKYLPQFLDKLDEGFDLVLGSRNVEGGGTKDWPWYRNMISKGGSLYSRAILGVPVRDLTSGFKCFARHVLEDIDLRAR